jgi:AraC-like DNA-binding protein
MSARTVLLSPRPALLPYVRHIRVLAAQREPSPYLRLPDGELELIVRCGDGDAALHAVGTRLTPLRKNGYEVEQALVVRFRAGGAYPFFGVPLSELTERVVAMDRLWGVGSATLALALRRATTSQARVTAVEEALATRLAGRHLFEPGSVATVRRAIRLIQTPSSLSSVESLAAQLGKSSRQLRRAFDAVTGLGPKQFLRVARFQRALRSARRGDPNWALIAAQTGYYDQAHLIAEFHALAGATPSGLLGGFAASK